MGTPTDAELDASVRRVLNDLLAQGAPYSALPLMNPATNLLPPAVMGVLDASAAASGASAAEPFALTASDAQQAAVAAEAAAIAARDAAAAARDDIIDIPLVNDRDNGQGGIMAPTAPIISESSAGMTSGRVYLARFVPTRDMTIRAVAFELTANASSNDPVEVGILDRTATEKLGTSGAVTGYLNTGAGIKSVPLIADTPLVAGETYYAFWITVAATTSASVRRCAVFADLFGSGVGVAEAMGANGKTHPLAVPVTGLAQNDVAPFLGIKEST